jgi:site-specific DNA recombinase
MLKNYRLRSLERKEIPVTEATTTKKEVVARGKDLHTSPGYAMRAVLYLRVSTAGQASTSGDGEGFSIAAQRDACTRKTNALSAEVVDIYVDAGESARKSDRPNLQIMLERLRTERDVDFVVVHKVDRLARNRGDDVNISLAIREAGAQLVSVSENIDETPSGMLLHGIMSSIAEFYSLNLAAEVKKGTLKKVEGGTYPGFAPLGYLNRQDLSGGTKRRWIELDPERAPLIRWAFRAYASDEYSLRQLAEELMARWLTSRPTAQRPARNLTPAQVHKILCQRFYLGYFKYAGVEYQGSHCPLVSIEIFAKAQAVMASRRQAGERPQRHRHYLKGTILCARCGSRLTFSRNQGRRGGVYDYFVCGGRHHTRNECDLPYIPASGIEVAIENYYDTFILGKRAASLIHSRIMIVSKRRNESVERRAKRSRKRIIELEKERRKLLQAHLAGAVPVELLAEEQTRITAELANSGAALANIEIHWEALSKSLKTALGLIVAFGAAYRAAEPAVRRTTNQAVFEWIKVDVGGRITEVRLAQPFKLLLDEDLLSRLEEEIKNPTSSREGGSNLDLMVGAEV